MNKEVLIIEDKNKKTIIELEKIALKKERKEIRNKILLILFFIVSILISFSFGMFYQYLNTNIDYTTNIHKEINSIFKNNWLYINENEKFDEDFYNKSLKGATTFENDPYTNYLTKSETEEFSKNINMNFVGVGIGLEEDVNKNVYIERVYNNTPGSEAGLLAGDLIYKINDEIVLEKGSAYIRELAIGQEGTIVNITVKRLDKEITFKITRRMVDASSYGEVKDNYYYLNISSFGLETVSNVKKLLLEMKRNNLTSLIIDLRNNGGGYLTSAQELLGLFLKQRSIVLKQVDSQGNQDIVYTKDTPFDFIEKVVILQNNQSASSSEVFILGMKEQFSNTITVGEKTYGKGVIQGQIPLSDGGTLKITTAKWISSNDVWIEKNGIDPDYLVETPKFLTSNYIALKEDVSYRLKDANEIISLTRDALKYIGYESEEMGGYFDNSLEQAIISFQKDQGIAENPVIDINLQRSIVSVVKNLYQKQGYEYDPQLKQAIELIYE